MLDSSRGADGPKRPPDEKSIGMWERLGIDELETDLWNGAETERLPMGGATRFIGCCMFRFMGG
jgi:hypothetical protein